MSLKDQLTLLDRKYNWSMSLPRGDPSTQIGHRIFATVIRGGEAISDVEAICLYRNFHEGEMVQVVGLPLKSLLTCACRGHLPPSLVYTKKFIYVWDKQLAWQEFRQILRHPNPVKCNVMQDIWLEQAFAEKAKKLL